MGTRKTMTEGETADTEQGRVVKRRLTTFDELNSRVEQLTGANKDLEATLRELVEACEAGGTVRYMKALGNARLLIGQLDRVKS